MKRLRKGNLDTRFLWIVLVILALGVVTYVSTSLSIYTADKSLFWSLIIRHLGLGVVGGLCAMYIVSRIEFRYWKQYSLYLFIASVLVTALVFVPGLGFEHGGARRWVSLGFISFQPAEFLKIGVILFLSAWFAHHQKQVRTFTYGLLAFWIIVGIAFAVLAPQPDTGTMALIGIVAFAIYWLRGASLKHIAFTAVVTIALAGIYTAINPHVIDRIQTFMNADSDPYGSSYQIRQSRIAIGAGKLYGRGLGQSVHKFGSYLPESNSDSIFAIYAEEFGFVGSTILISLYVLLGFYGLRIARYAPTIFSQNVVTGIILAIIIQVFFNIASISGMVPLSGLPLIFMSHGGTALFITLASLGIVLNVSRYTKYPRS
jgi:cell division protein FtsW